MPDAGDLFRLVGSEPCDGQKQLARAVAVAAAAHAGHIDKSGNAYILHPMRVMLQCREHGDTVQAVAVLHDVVEDTWVTLDDLRALGFTTDVIEAVDAISHREGESYVDYIERCSMNRIAALVKLADLDDNSDPIRRIGPEFDRFLKRYDKARLMIRERLGIA